MKVINTTSKKIMLINNIYIKPYGSVKIFPEKGDELYQQVKRLEQKGVVLID